MTFGADQTATCAFEYLAGKGAPCWGEITFDDYGEELVGVCRGHITCSLYAGTSDEENLNRYVPQGRES